ncbi:MAG: SGNH/GDSL hydrolase family protein [Planctomycetaceae bacterium]|nr:SGNH/GDSL hydrolase family protein [Planctomycetales bacterium]MCB9926825.1 SGNH/GDSL hydrolase family protein [Planctomycetaceae bacterium]
MNRSLLLLAFAFIGLMWLRSLSAQSTLDKEWQYNPSLLRPFWQGDTVEKETALFIRNEVTSEGRASVLFPITRVLSVSNSAGDKTYEEGRDYVWRAGSREIILPAGSRIVSQTPQDLRRPAKSQKYELTHRDGNGEIFFGAMLEYHEMQTSITYEHAIEPWDGSRPKFAVEVLPRTIDRLRRKKALSIVLLGDSISTGCNASGWANGKPFQPAYPELLREHLEVSYGSKVTLTNLSVGGTSTPWGVTMVDQVVAHHPQLVILAFGMNDSAGRSAEEYKANTKVMVDRIRESLPDTEFILVASMLGNRDWIRLKHEVFPQYRDALADLCEPGIALADLTSMWSEFLKRKRDWDLTGNGVNHPNDFGHRVYAQVLSTLLVPGAD